MNREREEEEKKKKKQNIDAIDIQKAKKKNTYDRKKDNCCVYIKNQKSIEWAVNSNC